MSKDILMQYKPKCIILLPVSTVASPYYIEEGWSGPDILHHGKLHCANHVRNEERQCFVNNYFLFTRISRDKDLRFLRKCSWTGKVAMCHHFKVHSMTFCQHIDYQTTLICCLMYYLVSVTADSWAEKIDPQSGGHEERNGSPKGHSGHYMFGHCWGRTE